MIFIVPALRATRVNLKMNDYVSGLPSPLALLGLAEALARKLDLEPWSARVLPVLHSVSISEGRSLPGRVAKGSAFTPIEIVEDVTGEVHLSLILDIPGLEDEVALNRAMRNMRIGGGLLQGSVTRARRVQGLGSDFRSLMRGYAMLPAVWRPLEIARQMPVLEEGEEPGLRSFPERQTITAGTTSGFAAIADTLFRVEKGVGFGLPIPCAIGHHLIEDEVMGREGVRDPAIPHAFVEPLMGVAELVSVRNRFLTDLDASGFCELMWGWQSQGHIVTAHPSYHPDINKEIIHV